MDKESTADIQVELARPDDVAQALWLVLADEPSETRAARAATLVASQGDGGSLKHLVVAKRRETIVGAALGQVLGGKTAIVWPPRLAGKAEEAVADSLLNDVNSRLAADGVRLAQAMLPGGGSTDEERLIRHGYDQVIDLRYLHCVSEQFPSERPTTVLEFEPFHEPQLHRLRSLVERTYEGTLDVPALNGVRDIADVIDGYRQTGTYSPDRWFFVRFEQHDVGCLILTDHPDQKQLELVYMGLIPTARGHGWGADVTEFAKWQTRTAQRERLILAVDAQNDPAITAYSRTGFSELTRRHIRMKIFT